MSDKLRDEIDGLMAHKGSGLSSAEVRSMDFAKAQTNVQMVYIRAERENAELRELCASLYEFAMSEYPDGTELNFANRMREMGVEVDDG